MEVIDYDPVECCEANEDSLEVFGVTYEMDNGEVEISQVESREFAQVPRDLMPDGFREDFVRFLDDQGLTPATNNQRWLDT